MDFIAGTGGSILLLILMGLALLGTVLGLPGPLIAFVLALIYGALTHFAELTTRLVVILLVMSLAAEGADQLLGLWTARRYGASLRGLLGSIAGGIAGALLLGAVVPIIGAVVGAFLGAYVGTLLAERSVTGDWSSAHRAAWGTFVGRVAGTVLKLVVGGVMIYLVARAIL